MKKFEIGNIYWGIYNGQIEQMKLISEIAHNSIVFGYQCEYLDGKIISIKANKGDSVLEGAPLIIIG